MFVITRFYLASCAEQIRACSCLGPFVKRLVRFGFGFPKTRGLVLLRKKQGRKSVKSPYVTNSSGRDPAGGRTLQYTKLARDAFGRPKDMSLVKHEPGHSHVLVLLSCGRELLTRRCPMVD